MMNNRIFVIKISYLYFIFSLLTIIIITIPTVSADTYDYSVSVPNDLKQLKILRCIKKHFRHKKTQFNTIEKQTKDNCLEFKVRLKSAVMQRLKGVSTNQQILTDPNEWFPYPENFSSTDKINIIFNHSSRVSVSAPWKLITRTKTKTQYQIFKRPLVWDSIIAFGHFKVEDFYVDKALVRYALLAGERKVDETKIRNWMKKNINALRTVYGTLPVTSLQLLVVPLGKGGEPVPWGEVMRGGGDAVHLYIDDTRTTQEFFDDWVFSHELSHLLYPKITQTDAWFYEGMASYYQNVARARVGLLTPNEAWKKLHAGFERGIKNTQKNKTLAEITKSMMLNRAFMRVYWSGAAISLLADVKLRQLSNNKKSLDSILHLFQNCCMQRDRLWNAYEVMKKFDELSNTSVFTDLYSTNVVSTAFPDLTQIYKQLGFISVNGKLEILNNVPGTIRDKIMKQ